MLELKNVSFLVDNDSKEIIKDINLKIDDGKFIVITGPNGGGKSTLAKIIMGIEKPSSGQIILDGKDITEMSVTERAKEGVSFAFQQPVRFKGIDVKDILTIAAGGKLTDEDAKKLLEEVGLTPDEYITRSVDTSLSGGELKRIEIATLLARKTKLSIFDEPEAGIDLWSFKNLIEVFEKIHSEIHGSIIIISHQERIFNIADEIAVIANGQIKAYGPKDEILPELLKGSENCKYYQ